MTRLDGTTGGFVKKTGDTMTGNLVLSGGNFIINTPSSGTIYNASLGTIPDTILYTSGNYIVTGSLSFVFWPGSQRAVLTNTISDNTNPVAYQVNNASGRIGGMGDRGLGTLTYSSYGNHSTLYTGEFYFHDTQGADATFDGGVLQVFWNNDGSAQPYTFRIATIGGAAGINLADFDFAGLNLQQGVYRIGGTNGISTSFTFFDTVDMVDKTATFIGGILIDVA